MNQSLGLLPRALLVLAVFPVATLAQVPVRKPAQPAVAVPPPAVGEVVAATGPSVMYVYQAANGDYWFGSNDAGVYRYDGKTLVRFTTKDGLVADSIRGIQEDRAGNLFFTTYVGTSRFDGRSFTTLRASEGEASDWKNQPDDLWFVGGPDEGVVYRYDGDSLYRLHFPRTALGDAHFREMPRDKFPDAKYNPYDTYCIVRDSKGTLWFGTTCCGVCRFDGKEIRWLTDNVLTSAPVRSIFEDREGDYWFSYSGGNTIDGFRPVEAFDAVEKDAKGSIVEGMSIVQDDDGHLWTGAYTAGAFRFDGDRAVNYPIREGDTPIQVFAIYKDRKGVLWLGTHNGGAYRFNGKEFEKFKP